MQGEHQNIMKMTLGIKYLNLLPEKVLIWSYGSETVFKNNKFSIKFDKHYDEA